MIKLQHLSKAYGTTQVLRNINLEFAQGHIYGIVGKNGAGKTTLFRCIAGLESYEGNVVSDKSRLKDHLGLLLTELYFFPKITGAEYIRLLCNARGVAIEDINERNLFDLPLNQYAVTYSTGMKKKLALTAILLQQNDYFILDEPFNGVDIQSNIVIMEIIRKLRERDKTVIISSHIFSTLSETCDEIHLLSDGAITKSVQRPDFATLEQDMKADFVGGLADKLIADF